MIHFVDTMRRSLVTTPTLTSVHRVRHLLALICAARGRAPIQKSVEAPTPRDVEENIHVFTIPYHTDPPLRIRVW